MESARQQKLLAAVLLFLLALFFFAFLQQDRRSDAATSKGDERSLASSVPVRAQETTEPAPRRTPQTHQPLPPPPTDTPPISPSSVQSSSWNRVWKVDDSSVLNASSQWIGKGSVSAFESLSARKKLAETFDRFGTMYEGVFAALSFVRHRDLPPKPLSLLHVGNFTQAEAAEVKRDWVAWSKGRIAPLVVPRSFMDFMDTDPHHDLDVLASAIRSIDVIVDSAGLSDGSRGLAIFKKLFRQSLNGGGVYIAEGCSTAAKATDLARGPTLVAKTDPAEPRDAAAQTFPTLMHRAVADFQRLQLYRIKKHKYLGPVLVRNDSFAQLDSVEEQLSRDLQRVTFERDVCAFWKMEYGAYPPVGQLGLRGPPRYSRSGPMPFLVTSSFSDADEQWVDKLSTHRYNHAYEMVVASQAFRFRRDVEPPKKLRLLEIGFGGGYSYKFWQKWFAGNIEYKAIDFLPCDTQIRKATFLSRFEKDDICRNSWLGDQCSETQVAKLLPKIGTFDIVSDDGAHTSPCMRHSLEKFWRAVRPGGVYVVEDIAFCTRNEGRTPGETFVDSLRRVHWLLQQAAAFGDDDNPFGKRYENQPSWSKEIDGTDRWMIPFLKEVQRISFDRGFCALWKSEAAVPS